MVLLSKLSGLLALMPFFFFLKQFLASRDLLIKMDQELKIGNPPQRQLEENQAMRFLSKRVELPA